MDKIVNDDGFGGPSLWDSFKLTAISALRTAPMWITAGVFGAAMLSTTNNQEEVDPPSALVEFGLTDQVVWPFFDVALSEALSRSQALESSVEEILGDSLIGYDATLPEGRGIVKVLITTATTEQAEQAATLVGTEVVQQNLLGINEDLAAQIQLFRDAESDGEAELARVVAEIDAVTAQFTPTILEASRRNLDQQLQVLFIERDAAQRSWLDSRRQADDLERQLVLANSEIELANVTVTTPEPEPISRVLLVATGLGIAIAAAAVLTTWHRDFGPIRSESQLRSIFDLPVVPYPDPDKVFRSVPLARQLVGLQQTGVRAVGFSSIPNAPECVDEISGSLSRLNSFKKFGATFNVSTDKMDHANPNIYLASLDPNSDSIVSSHLESQAAFVVVSSKGTKLRTLRARIRDLSTLGLDVQGVVLK